MKYSIIIPTHNALMYLPTCINTIINQGYQDYELIISDDNSTDGTKEYLSSIKCKHVKVVHTKERYTMVEHFEWAYQFAIGEWIMFLGSDDGLQSYFFKLADLLTKKANETNIRAIMSSRAYYFWDGCESLYGNKGIIYRARKEFKILNSKKETLLALFGFQPYFELPEMYTTSLFKNSLISDARKLQKGRIFTTIPPDANLGAIAMSLEKNYLKSFIPLGWVGTSSINLAPLLVLPASGILVEGIIYNKEAGHYSINEPSLFFWNAFLRTKNLRNDKLNIFLTSKFVKYILYAGVLSNIRKKNYKDTAKKIEFSKNAIIENSLNKNIVMILSRIISLLHYLYKYSKGFYNILKSIIYPSYQLKIKRNGNKKIDLFTESIKISKIVEQIINEK